MLLLAWRPDTRTRPGTVSTITIASIQSNKNNKLRTLCSWSTVLAIFQTLRRYLPKIEQTLFTTLLMIIIIMARHQSIWVTLVYGHWDGRRIQKPRQRLANPTHSCAKSCDAESWRATYVRKLLKYPSMLLCGQCSLNYLDPVPWWMIILLHGDGDDRHPYHVLKHLAVQMV